MRKLHLSVVLGLVVMFSTSAFAQFNRTFVATSGSDTSTCSATAPCRSFSRAISLTNPGGEIIALTSGGYGPFTIDRSVSVLTSTGAASITVPDGATAIHVAAAATDHVVLRGLTITVGGTGNGANGILATTFRTLAIDNCSITGGDSGIKLASHQDSRAEISDTVVRRASTGIRASSPAVIVRTRAYGGISGLAVTAGGRVTTTDFVAHGNLIGSWASTDADGPAILTVDRAVLSNNSEGARSQGSEAVVRISNSVLTDNSTYGLVQSNGGVLASMNNNLVQGSGVAATFGTITTITPQ